MFAEQNSIRRDTKLFEDAPFYPKLFVKPGDHCFAKHADSARIRSEHRHQNALELHQWLLMKNHVVQITCFDTGLLQTELDGELWKAVIVFLAAETLLFSGCEQVAVLNQSCGGVVIEAGDTEDIHLGRREWASRDGQVFPSR